MLTLGVRGSRIWEGGPVTDSRGGTTSGRYELMLRGLEGDPYLTYDCERSSLEDVEIEVGHAVAWISWHPHRQARWLTALSHPDDSETSARAAIEVALRLAQRCEVEGRSIAGITLPRGGFAMIPRRLRPTATDDWDWWCASAAAGGLAPPRLLLSTWAGTVPVRDLHPDDPRLAALLALASPNAPIRPGDPRVSRWAGIEESGGDLADAGGLVAMVALVPMESGAVHLNDVATHPLRRGRGLARALCATVASDVLAQGRPAVTLGMYAHNDAARALYTSLGFTCGRRNTSGSLPPG